MKALQFKKFNHRVNTARLFILQALFVPLTINAAEVSTLDKINVTATRTAQTVDETLAAVTVINREEIEKSQAKDITQLLDGLPGLTLNSNGGLGTNAGIRLRGTSGKHVLVLIDGVQVGSATLGTTSFQHIPLSQIERIEIVRGPRSQLYGSAAVGGMIQIFTRQGDKERQITAEVGYGTHETANATLGVSDSKNNTDYNLRIAQLSSEGFNALKNNNPDKDGYDNQSLSTHLGHHFSSNLKANINFLHAEGNTEYDDAWGPADEWDADFVQQSLNGMLEYTANDIWDIKFTLGRSKDETMSFSNGAYVSDFTTKRSQVSWQNDLLINDDNVLTVGLDLTRDKVNGSSNYSINERDNKGLFIQHQTTIAANDLVIGLRRDDSDSFDKFNTGNIAWGRDVTDKLRLIASYGTAFKTPTFNDLYYQDLWGSNGNPNLLPEESQSVELGIEGKQSWGLWDLRVFRTDIEKLITWVETAPWVYQPQNVNEARINGGELSISTRLVNWDVAGYLTLLDPRDTTTDKLLVERNKRTLRLDADRTFGKTEVGATLQARSESFSEANNTLKIAGSGTVDLRVNHTLSKIWTLSGRVRNLFDKDYETIRTYNTAGREFFVTLAYQP